MKNPVVDSILDNTSVRFLGIPSLGDLLEASEVAPFSYDTSYSQVAEQAFLVLHTSGSTGLPKPVTITHGLMACIDAQKLLPPIDGREVTSQTYRDTQVYTALPPFHVRCIALPLLLPLTSVSLLVSTSSASLSSKEQNLCWDLQKGYRLWRSYNSCWKRTLQKLE